MYAYRHPRENYLAQGRRYRPRDELLNRLGICFSQGINKIDINYSARVYNVNMVLANYLKRNDPIFLRRNSNGHGWDVCVKGQNGQFFQVGELAWRERNRLNQIANEKTILEGLFVNDIFIWRYKDSLRSDAYNGTTYTMEWSDQARADGFILVVDFAGYIEF